MGHCTYWLFVQFAKWIERVFGRKADANLCVTKVMQQWLLSTWQIQATVLHDKPPLFFKPTPLEIQHELFGRVGDQLSHCNDVRGTQKHLAITQRRLKALVFCCALVGSMGQEPSERGGNASHASSAWPGQEEERCAA